MLITPLTLISFSVLLLLLFVLIVPLLKGNQRLLINAGFSSASFASLLGIAGGVWAVGGGITSKLILPLGLPDIPFHLRADP